ncbi:MAG: glycosyltransferase family 4 protein [Acidimicrobiales bacterium]
MEPPATTPDASAIAALAASSGLRRIHILAWRDLEDPEAGGSEVHIDEVARRWAAAGIEITMRTSFAPGRSSETFRGGYRVIRKAGRYLVFPRATLSERLGRHGPSDALVEVWNGMPFLSPAWYSGPRLVILHHVHAEMWGMVLPPTLAAAGNFIERRLAPILYRRSQVATLAESSRDELVHELRFSRDRVTVVPPGLHERFRPAPDGEPHPRSAEPLVVAVGRLVPVKRFDLLIRAAARAREQVPGLRLRILGEGYERDALEALVRQLDASDWVELPGRVDDEALVAAYRGAWLVASTSLREGWGMTLTEAAACGTPAVATRIRGHTDAVLDGRTGLLAEDADVEMALVTLLSEPARRAEMGRAARAHAGQLTWERTAHDLLQILADQVPGGDRRTPAARGTDRPSA